MGHLRLDQFYTSPDVAAQCWRVLEARAATLVDWDRAQFYEPSAGTGAFLYHMPPGRRRGMDLEPKARGVEYGDFLKDVSPDHLRASGHVWVVAGNPPFGFAASMAVKFFNHAAQFAEVIAFIVPRTFRKASVINRLDMNFHRVHDSDLPEHAFIREGEPHDVPCAWQVWHKQSKRRKKIEHTDVSNWIRYTDDVTHADFALRRVGGRAGQVLRFEEGVDFSPSSTYFIIDLCGWAQEALERADLTKVREQTAGVRSVSKLEIAEALAKEAQ